MKKIIFRFTTSHLVTILIIIINVEVSIMHIIVKLDHYYKKYFIVLQEYIDSCASD